jgi:hypothetical protein
MVAIAPNNFDRAKPFYTLVVNYIVLLAGFKELAVRGVTGPQKLEDVFSRVLMLGPAPSAAEPVVAELRKGLSQLLGPLQLKSEFTNDHITVEIDELARELVSNFSYLSSALMRSAGSLLILAHELTKDEPWHDQGPLWEFLRHTRNAAAHGGSFNLLHGEPKRIARWGRFEIMPALNKTPLFSSANGPGLIFPGDAVRLLWDIEQAYPLMRA